MPIDGAPRGAAPPEFVTGEQMLCWIEDVVAQGIRRPGYPADRWTEQFLHDTFVALGLERVRFEALECAHWEDRGARLTVDRAGAPAEDLDCFPVPFSRPGAVRGELAVWDPAIPDAVAGKVAVYDLRFDGLPETFPIMRRGIEGGGGSHPPAAAGWAYDPAGTFTAGRHRLPFAAEIQDTMEPAIAAGAIGFVGVLRGYPGGSCEYYVPYDGRSRSIPGVYVTAATGDRLADPCAQGGVSARIEVDADRGTTTTRNVVGELPGADDDWVIVGTHHDAPWASAVEDGSGIALLLAQAAAWASVPRSERPHRLVFLASAAHMAGGAGTQAFIDRHGAMMGRTVLEVHLEHAARDTVARGGREVPTDQVTPRWWFTTERPDLESTVWEAIVAEGLDRSLILTPDALHARPTTDGGFFHEVGVPLVNYLAAPWYLFDPADTLDKVDPRTLSALTRAAFTIVASTRA